MPTRANLLAEVLRIHGELVSSGAALSVALTQLIQGACKLAGVKPEFGVIRIVDPDQLILRQDIRGDGWGRVLGPENKVPPANSGIMGRVLRTRQSEIVKDVRKDADYLALSPNIRSELAVPLLLKGQDRCWGVLNLESEELDYFRRSLIPWMQALATEAALTIQQDELRDQLKQIEIAEAIGTDANKLKTHLMRIATDTVSILRDKGASVEILALSGKQDALVTLAFFTDNPLGAIPGHIAPASTLAWRAIDERRIVSYPDIALDEPSTRTSVSDSRTALVFPLYDLDGTIIGVFNVEAPTAHALDGVESLLRHYCNRAEEVLQNTNPTARLSASSLASVMKEVGERITSIDSPRVPETVYHQILRRAVQMVGRHDIQAAIAFLEHGELTITPQRTYNYNPSPETPWILSQDRTVVSQALLEKTSVLIPDVQAPESGYLPQIPSSRCELAVPLIYHQTVIGVILLIAADPGAMDKGDQNIIEYLADQVLHARVHAEQVKQRQQDREHLDLIQRTNKAIQEMLSEQDLAVIRRIRDQALRDLIHHAKQLTASDYASINVPFKVPPWPSRIEEGIDTEMVLLLVDPPREDEVVEPHFPITKGIVSQAYLTKETQRVNDVKARRDQFVTLFTDNIESELAVPMYNGDRVLGVFNLESSTHQTYPREQVQWVEMLASQAANVISFSELHLLRRQLEILQSLEQGIVEGTRDEDSPSLDRLFQPILQAALELTEQPDGYASLWLTHGNTLRRDAYFPKNEPSLALLALETRPRLDSGAAPEFTGNGSSFISGIAGLADFYQEPMLVLDISGLPWKGKVVLSWDLAQSAIAVPLLDPTQPKQSPARVIGILSVQSRRKRDFNERHMQILQLLTQTAMVSLRNSALYRSKITMLRDISHAFEKAIWPLRISAAELRRTPYDPTQAHYNEQKYKKKAQEIASLTDLAGNLLDWFHQLVKYEDGDSRSAMEPTSMNNLVHQIVKKMRPFAIYERKKIALEVLSQDLQVTCASDLVKAVIFLLIENALTYSPDKDTIIVRMHQTTDGSVQIGVIDHGESIPEEERDYLFEPGFQGSAASSLLAGGRGIGSGIGLDHVRRIIEKLHHGEAGYQALNDGNLFYIQLPKNDISPQGPELVGVLEMLKNTVNSA